MILRTFYAIINAYRYRKHMREFLNNPQLQIKNITALTPAHLQQLNIEALALDFDGVLAAHGEPEPRPEVITWLQNFVKAYAPHQIFILSNKPTPIRAEYFAQNFPNINFVIAKRKKPYPDGMQQIIAAAGVPASKVLLVDDRLGTGILVTCITGSQALWVTEPYVNLKARPITESGFIILRCLEKFLLSL